MTTAIFFDLDGTLTNPKVGITTSIQFALQEIGKPAPAMEDLTWCIGPPLHESLISLAGGDEAGAQALKHYRARYAEVGLYENEVYPGVAAMLQALTGRDIPLYVATSKPHVFAEPILAHFGLARYFQRVFGSELDGRRANKTELLAYALAETGHAGATSLMVGDRKHDMIGAANNAMTGLGVLYGYGDAVELTAAGTTTVFKNVKALSDYLLGIV